MIPNPLVTLFLACCVLLAPDLSAQRKPELDKEAKIKEWGYQIRPIKGWTSMPADQDDRLSVGLWKMSLDDLRKRGLYEEANQGSYCELRIVRLQPKVETPSGSGAAGKQEEAPALPAALRAKLEPKNMDEWIENTWPGAAKRTLREPLKGGKMPGDLLEFGSNAEHVTIGVFRHLGVEWAVVYTSFEEIYKRDWRDIYMKSLQTFRVTDKVSDEVAAANRKDISTLEGDEKRAALKATIAGKPGWYAIDTKYYVFLSNADRGYVESLAKDLEAVREQIYVPMFKPRNQKQPLNPVRIFATRTEFQQYGQTPYGVVGYFSPRKGELVLFEKWEDQSATKSREESRSVMYHEGFHQYIHYAIGDVSPHSWFNEGHGDYFAGLSVSGGKVSSKPKLFDWRVKELKDYINQDKDLIPLRSLLRYEQGEYYQNAIFKYSQGWALIYYLRTVSKNADHKQALDTYFNYLADNVTAFRAKKKEGEEEGADVPVLPGIWSIDFEDREKVKQILSEAIDKGFAKIDLEALDKELREWIATL